MPKQSTCKWEQDEDGNWNTSCNEEFIITEGTPSENKMVYCTYCGARIETVLYVEPVIDDE